MKMGQLQMMIYSIVVGLIGIGGLIYILVERPPYLHASRNGVPYFTPEVVNPQGGKPLNLNALVRNYKGQN